MSTVLRAVQSSWRSSFGRAAGAAGAVGVLVGCSVRERDGLSQRGNLTCCEQERAAKRLRRTASEGMQRRDLVRCRGGQNELGESYELKDRLGSGSFGSVRKAIHRMTGLPRAIKSVEMMKEGEEGLHRGIEAEWDRMLAEVEALMDLDHPNIVRLYEYFRTPDTLFLVEEYCSGGTLEQRLETAGGRFSAEESAVVLRQMLRGLLCCHAHGLAHRDLKPDNFVYGSSDPSASLKMIDFGLSLAPGQLTPLAYVEAAGTLEYTAPETLPRRDNDGRLTRAVRYNQAADMWSVGAILFLMLTGEPLVDFERLRTSSAEFRRMMKAVVGGVERDLLDDAATKVRNEKFINSRLAVARRHAPPAACELLAGLLELEPSKRLSATQALKHRFITDSYRLHPRGHGVFDGEIIPKMRRFADAPALRRLAVLVEAHLLGPQDDDAIRKCVLTFRSADSEGLGILKAADIGHALREQGLEVPDDLSEICACIDVNGDGTVNLIEFVAATMEPQVFCEPRLCKAAFRVLDHDGDGYITQADLQAMLMEGPHRKERAQSILESAEMDERGRIDFARFCAALVPTDADPSLAVRVAEYMSKSFV